MTSSQRRSKCGGPRRQSVFNHLLGRMAIVAAAVTLLWNPNAFAVVNLLLLVAAEDGVNDDAYLGDGDYSTPINVTYLCSFSTVAIDNLVVSSHDVVDDDDKDVSNSSSVVPFLQLSPNGNTLLVVSLNDDETDNGDATTRISNQIRVFDWNESTSGASNRWAQRSTPPSTAATELLLAFDPALDDTLPLFSLVLASTLVGENGEVALLAAWTNATSAGPYSQSTRTFLTEMQYSSATDSWTSRTVMTTTSTLVTTTISTTNRTTSSDGFAVATAVNGTDIQVQPLVLDDDLVALVSTADGTVIVTQTRNGAVQAWKKKRSASFTTRINDNGNTTNNNNALVWEPMGQPSNIIATLSSTTFSTTGVSLSNQHLSLSANGTVLAIGDESRRVVHVYRYYYRSNEWMPWGAPNITLPATSDTENVVLDANATETTTGTTGTTAPHVNQSVFGHAVSVSADGTVVAVGAPCNASSAARALPCLGQVHVYQYTETTRTSATAVSSVHNAFAMSSQGIELSWSPLGQILQDEQNNSETGTFGSSIALSSTGLVLAISSGSGGQAGVHMYTLFLDGGMGAMWQEDESGHTIDTASTNNSGSSGNATAASMAMSADGRTIAYLDDNDIALNGATVQVTRYDSCLKTIMLNSTIMPTVPGTAWPTAPPMETIWPTPVPFDATTIGAGSTPPPQPSNGETTRKTEHELLVGVTLNFTGVGRLLGDWNVGGDADVATFQTLLAGFIDDYIRNASAFAGVAGSALETTTANGTSTSDEQQLLDAFSGMHRIKTIVLVSGQELFDAENWSYEAAAASSSPETWNVVNRISYVQTTSYATWEPTAAVDWEWFIQLPFQDSASREALRYMLVNSSIQVFDALQDIGVPALINTSLIPQSSPTQPGAPLVSELGDEASLFDSAWAIVVVSVGAVVAVIVVLWVSRKIVNAKQRAREDKVSDDDTPVVSTGTAPLDGETPVVLPPPPAASLYETSANEVISAEVAAIRQRPLEPLAPISRIKFVHNGRADDESSVSRMSTEGGSLSKPITATPPLSHRSRRFISASSSSPSAVTPQFVTAVAQLEPEGHRSFIDYLDTDIVVAVEHEEQPHYKDQMREANADVIALATTTAVVVAVQDEHSDYFNSNDQARNGASSVNDATVEGNCTAGTGADIENSQERSVDS